MFIIWQKSKQLFGPLFIATLALFSAGAMLIWPQETYEGARYGLELWASVIVPSLLPFFILSEILLCLGLVNLLGVILEPVMRPVFNLPGSTSFVVAMGFTSGFPMGAVLTRRLYEENICTAEEGERLVAFTNNFSPLFILGAIAVGMFNNPLLGTILLLSHYLSSITLGIVLGHFAPRSACLPPPKKDYLIARAIRALLESRENRKPWGKIFTDAIRLGINNISLIGGFIVLYSVLVKILHATDLLPVLARIFSLFLALAHAEIKASSALALGFFEITLGLKELSALSLSLSTQAVFISLLMGWSGLSILSQVTGILSGSKLSPRLFLRTRPLQGLIAALYAYGLATTRHLWWKNLSAPVTLMPFQGDFFGRAWYFAHTTGLNFLKSLLLLLFLVFLMKLYQRLFSVH